MAIRSSFIVLFLLTVAGANGLNIDKLLLEESINDNDLDGVPNGKDLCPNSNLLELVDSKGCSKSQKPQKIKKYKVLVSLESNYLHKRYKNNKKNIKKNDSYSYSMPIEVDILYKNWIYGLTFGYIREDDGANITSGVIDTSLTLGYIFSSTNNEFITKAEIILPTSKSFDNSVYKISLENYYIKKSHNFAYKLSYELGSDISKLEAMFDYSYSFKKFDVGFDYTLTKPLKKSHKPLHNIGIYTTYYINNSSQITFEYKKPLSNIRDYDNLSLKYSYSF